MSGMNLPRQLLPVKVTIEGGEFYDRNYWRDRLMQLLSNQPCDTKLHPSLDDKRMFTIYPNANND